MRIFSLLVIVLVLPLSFGYSQNDKILQDVDKYLAKAQRDWNIPGMAVGIIKDGKVIHSKGYGIMKQGSAERVSGGTLFAIASNTKAFISAALSILEEEGKLSWDDPVQKHLPYFKLYDEYASQHTTVRDLLCHRVGLGTFSGDAIWYNRNMPAEEVVKRAAEVPQAYEYRAGYGYSNLMFITAGEVIKAVSGKSWAQFVEERIFKPLGMNQSCTSVTQLPKRKSVATPHKPVNGENIPIEWVNWDNMGAAGGIISNTDDMLKWMNLQLQQGKYGEKQLFSAASQRNFWHPHNNNRVSEAAQKQYEGRHFSGYGLGWGLSDYRGRLLTSHGGGYDGMYSRLVLVPEEQMGIVVLTNSMKGISTPLTYYIIDAMMGLTPKDWSAEALERQKSWDDYRANRLKKRYDKHVKGTTADVSMDEMIGLYRCPMYGDIEIKKKGDAMTIHFSNAPNLDADLKHWHYNTYEIKWKKTLAWFGFGTVQFELSNDGAVTGLQFDVPNDDIFFEEINAVKVEQ
ncbi:MAG: serine hydrolase [Bacteroidota bacterium]